MAWMCSSCHCSPSIRPPIHAFSGGDPSAPLANCVTGNCPSSPASLRVMFAAGGTAGHVFPAIAIADALKQLHPSIQLQFVGTKDRLESTLVPNSGYFIHCIPAVGICRPFFSPKNLLFPFHLLVSVWMCLGLLRAFQPHLVVGTGGYVSVPLCISGLLFRCPIAIQEQNAFPGLANRALGIFAAKIFVAFSVAVSFFPKDRCEVSGNPIRSALLRRVSKAVAFSHFFPKFPSCSDVTSDQTALGHSDENSKHSSDESCRSAEVILVLGGSLGAKSINMTLTDMALQMLDTNPNRYLIWQTGSKYYEEIVMLIGKHPRLFITEFVNHIELAYLASDLVVARSGAITCSELLAMGKPSILVPSGNVAEDHQMKNAMFMLEAGAAKVLADTDLNSASLQDIINEVLGSDLKSMCRKALAAAIPDAALNIAREVSKLAKRSPLQKKCFSFPNLLSLTKE